MAAADADLTAYFTESQAWDADRRAQQARGARLAWWSAGAGWSCALGTAVALCLLMPLKRVDPFVIRVDNSTGIVDVVPVYAGNVPLEPSITRYFLTHYVDVCERFNFATAESDYQECGAFHSARRNQDWYAKWAPSNPVSPLNVHKDGSSLRAEVTAVSFFDRASGLSDLAQVRYLQATRQAAGGEEHITHWLATVRFAYAAPSTDPRVRRWNPLGFRVIEFRSEPEIITESKGNPE